MAKKGTPKLPDVETLIRAGIDPITRQPTRVVNKKRVKENLKRALRIIDEQDAVNRYKWYNLPLNISSQELERLLYYKGQLCFFYEKNTEEFYIMPFALDGTIDFYGRYNTIHPVPMSCGTEGMEKEQSKKIKKIYEEQRVLLSMLNEGIEDRVVQIAKTKLAKAISSSIELFETLYC